jgi:hypothetical protein
VPMAAAVRDTIAVRLIRRAVANVVVERMSLMRPLLPRTVGTRNDRQIGARCRTCRGRKHRPYAEASGGARAARRRVDVEEIERLVTGGIQVESQATSFAERVAQHMTLAGWNLVYHWGRWHRVRLRGGLAASMETALYANSYLGLDR